MYMPAIVDAQHVASYLVGPYIAMLFSNCVSQGAVEYTHVLFVYEPPDKLDPNTPPQRMMAVAAEVNRFPEGGSHFLGVFAGGHANLGASDDWADLQTFAEAALKIVGQRLEITTAPVELPPAE